MATVTGSNNYRIKIKDHDIICFWKYYHYTLQLLRYTTPELIYPFFFCCFLGLIHGQDTYSMTNNEQYNVIMWFHFLLFYLVALIFLHFFTIKGKINTTERM